MPLTCDSDGDYDWFYESPADYSTLATKRSRKCCSCKSRIAIGDTVLKFRCYRGPQHDIEESIYGDEVPMADKFMCESCGDQFYNLDALGFCISLGENMKHLLAEYVDVYVRKSA